MCKKLYIITALLILPFANTAAAEEQLEQHDKRAQKLLATLKMFGIANPEVKNLVQNTSAKIEKDGFYYLADKKTEDGRFALRMDCQGMPKMAKLQLAYVPKESHYSVMANTKGMMLNYHYSFK
jgi:hypothetical protein